MPRDEAEMVGIDGFVVDALRSARVEAVREDILAGPRAGG